MQGHLSTEYGLPTDMRANFHRFAKLGLKTAVTEADVRITFSASDPATPAEIQAQSNGYNYMLQSCLLERSCISFTVWGFTDKYSWIPGVFPGEGSGQPLRRELPAQARVRGRAARPRAGQGREEALTTG